MSSTIVINQSNLVADGYNNTYIYRFPNSVQFVNSEIAVSSLTTTYTITIPSGLFEIADKNNYFQYVMIQNGTYLINASKQNVYYAEFLVNPNSYAIQLNTFPVPTSLPSGFTAPVANTATGAVAYPGYPTTTNNMQVGIPASSRFNEIVGFASGFATGASTLGTNLSFLSTTTPQVQPNPSIYVAISNISNKYANPSTIIYSISPDVGFGEKIIERVPEYSWNRLLSGTYNELRLQFLGVDFSPIQLLDSNISVLLCIREKPKEIGDSK